MTTPFVKQRDFICEELMRLSIGLFYEGSPTGSRSYVSPPPLDTDDDYVFLVPEHMLNRQIIMLGRHDFHPCSSGYPESTFRSFKSTTNPINLILIKDRKFFETYKETTEIMIENFNLKSKYDRVSVFKSIRDLIFTEGSVSSSHILHLQRVYSRPIDDFQVVESMPWDNT